MRGARFTIALVTVLLVAVPLAVLAVAAGYDHFAASRAERELTEASNQLASMPVSEWTAFARDHRIEARRLARDGRVVADSATEDAAVVHSPMGRVEALVLAPFESPARVTPALAREGQRGFGATVSADGRFSLFTLRRPDSNGGSLELRRASWRGLRRLLPVGDEVVFVVLGQLVLAGLAALVLSRRLVRPLEDLAERSKIYPREALATQSLLARQDELGQLARSMTSLAGELEKRRRDTVDLAADVAHELKNPLATIAAAAELLGGPGAASADRRRLVEEQIGAAVARLRSTVDELLSLERLDAALPLAKRERVELAPFVDSILAEYRAAHPDWAFTLDAADAGEVELVPEAFRSLVRNLVDNALVQPSSRREVVVTAKRFSDAWTLTIRDFGPGVPEVDRERIFRRFFTRRPEGASTGTGLGLSIVSAVAASHGGSVMLDSTVDPGAAFVVRVPLA